ncbi:hypothetical protein GCM10023317_29130 [Actinopolymorpha pittospori]
MVGGIVGAGGLAAAAGVVTIVTPSAAPAAAAEQTVARSAADGGSKDDGKKDDDKRKDEDVKKVGCDPDELIAALVRANADGGVKLELEPKCTYTLTAFDEEDEEVSGLPEIVERVKIDGNGAKIVRAANAEAFRIFTVGVGGDLTLRDLTLKGGDARDSDVGGGALLVRQGGRASVEDSKLTLNRSDSFGGAITNLGITKINGGDKSEKDGGKKDDPKKDDYGKDGSDEYGKDGSKKDDYSEDSGSELTNNFAEVDGGGVYSTGSLKVEGARISRNAAGNFGGGLENDGGVATVSKTRIDHNQAVDDSGGIDNEEDSITTVKDSWVKDNTSGDDGGGIGNFGGTFYLQRTEVEGNTAADIGGGAVNFGTFVADKSEFNKNKALGDGAGGFANAGDAVLRKSEVNKNTAFAEDAVAGGIANFVDNGDEGNLRLTDTDVIENASTEAPGGIFNEVEDGVTVDDDSKIIKNRPTNCAGSPEEVPNCFG